jgi:hypothetical protein
VIDSNPTGGNGSDTLEKAWADIDRDGIPDAVLGMGYGRGGGPGGMVWYRAPSNGDFSSSWTRYTIAKSGDFYEHAAALDVDGDGWVDIVASDTGQLVWFQNPGASGDFSQPWNRIPINQGAGAHDFRVQDMDGDGRLDIVCSGSQGLGSSAFIAFQTDPWTWQNVGVANVGEGISLLDIGDGLGAIHIAAADLGTGDVSWWENPRARGQSARSAAWNRFAIAPGAGAQGNAFETGFLNGSGMAVVTAANETEGSFASGVVWYEPSADRRSGAWISHVVDTTYMAVHAIEVVDLDGDGAAEVVVGEQEQAGGAPCIAAAHPGIPSRVTVFYNDGSGGLSPQVISSSGGQNQVVTDLTGNGNMAILSANHGYYCAADPLEVWISGLGSSSGGGPRYEAESAQTNLAFETLWPGYSGTGYLCCWSNDGQQATFQVNVGGAGTYALSFGYSAGNGDAFRTLTVNGNTLQSNLRFPATPDWSSWATLQVSAQLNAGSNAISLVYWSASGSSNYINLDYLDLGGAMGSGGGLPMPAFSSSTVVSGGEVYAASSALQPATITVEAWIDASAPVGGYPAFVSFGPDVAPRYETYILQAETLDGASPADFYFVTADSVAHQVFGTTLLRPGQTYFIAATFDGSTASLYVNGNREGTIAASGTLGYFGGGLGLARKWSTAASNAFPGNTLGARIYGQALTAAQIAADGASGPP